MTERIEMVDLAALHRPLEPELQAAVSDVWRSQRFVSGPRVSALERSIETYLGVPHAIAVSSGTDALVCALLALGVRPGDEVVTTAFSFVATATAVARVGAEVVFADVDPDTWNLDAASVERVLTPRSRVVLPVHLFGEPADLDSLEDLCRRHDLSLVEDAAQAFGARYRDRNVGGFGRLGCFSFFPSKPLGAFGEAGLVTASDGVLARSCRELRSHGRRGEACATIGGNFRMDEVQGAVLGVKLPHLARWAERRRALARAYDEELSDVVTPQRKNLQSVSAVAQYTVRARDRDALAAHLAAQDIETRVYYSTPLHQQPCFRGSRPSLPVAESTSREVLSLPVHPGLSDEAQRRVIEAILQFYR